MDVVCYETGCSSEFGRRSSSVYNKIKNGIIAYGLKDMATNGQKRQAPELYPERFWFIAYLNLLRENSTLRQIKRNRVVYILSSAFAIAIMLVGILWWGENNPAVKSNIRIEVTKSLLQLSIIVIIGGFVAALYKSVETERLENQKEVERLREANQKEAERLREANQKNADQILKQDQLRAEIRADYLKRLGVLYREVKSARRSLRAAGLTTRFGNAPDTLSEAEANAYKEEIQDLNHAQLELEALKIEASSLPTFASINNLTNHLRKMEDYLRQILKEYEKMCPILDSGESIYFSQLEHLDEFTGRTSRDFKFTHYERASIYRLKSHFSEPYDDVIKLISQNLI